MAIRLGEYVVQGLVRNSGDYSTGGYVLLRGHEGDEEGHMVLRFSVTGAPGPDLKGKCVAFFPAEDDPTQKVLPREAFDAINPTQHGVTGTMTARGWTRALPCSVEEFRARAALGEPPPTEWRRNFVLEWFGPSGRITIELPGALVEFCTRERDRNDDEDDGDWEELPNLALPPWLDAGDSAPERLCFEREEETFPVEGRRPFEAPQTDLEFWERIRGDDNDRIDRAIAGYSEEKADQDLEDLQRFDYCMECGVQAPLTAFIGDWSTLPKPDELDDTAVEAALKSLLARLVLCGVVLDVCDHYTPRASYRLLVEEVIPNNGFHEELIGTGWITHFSTYDHCAKCEEEFEKEYEEYEREKERRESGGEE